MKMSLGEKFLAFLIVFTGTCFCQDDLRGFISVSDSSKVKVILDCGLKYMAVQLLFNETTIPEFNDWIVVGVNNNDVCRLRGNGETRYIIEIPVMNDPCGTRMIEEGTFENSIRIGQNDRIILQGDELVTVRCLYGLPEVKTPIIPSLPSTPPAYFSSTGPSSAPVETVQSGGLAEPYIYLIVFLILFLALLFLLCGCLYFFFKRRKLRLERRKKLILAVPPGSELNKLGLNHLFWSGKSSVSNDALLSHDYMLSGNPTREGGLSVSTDYAGDTPSTSSGSPENHMKGQKAGLANIAYSRHAVDNRQYPGGQIRVPATVHSLRSIPEGVRGIEETMRSQSITTVEQSSKTGQQSQHGKQKKADLYAPIDKSAQHRQTDQCVDLDSVKGLSGYNQEARRRPYSPSITIEDQNIHVDNGSISTLNGAAIVDESLVGRKPTMAADAHATAVLNQANAVSEEENGDWVEEFIRVVEQHRGIGPRKLTEQEISRWRALVENDSTVQEILLRSKSLEEFENLSRHPDYERLFTSEKWSIIVQSLAQVSFMYRLNQIIDLQGHEIETGEVLEPMHVKRRYVKKSDGPSARQVISAENLAIAASKEQRIFTRDSYYRVKEQVDAPSDDETPKTIDYTSERATTEFTEGPPSVRIHESPTPAISGHLPRYTLDTSENCDNQPKLNVYVGNMPARVVTYPHKSTVGSPDGSSLTTYGTSTYDNWQAHPDEL